MTTVLGIAISTGLALAAAPALALAGPPDPYDFAIQVAPSATAAGRLKAAGEHLDVEVTYYGYPNDDGEYLADDDGMVVLGRVNVILPPAGGQALIVGEHVDLARLGYLTDRGVQVSVSVFDSGPVDAASPIACEAFDDSLQVVRQEPLRLVCRANDGS